MPEFNLGNEASWKSHQAEMAHMEGHGMIDHDRIDHARMSRMGMMHSDPDAVLLAPAEGGEIIWMSPANTTGIGFACNMPGHREAGMHGQIAFRAGI